MKYRCPYCKETFAGEPSPNCPACGKVMLVPAMRKVSQRAERKRKVENIRRQYENKKAELRVVNFSTRRNPKLYFGMIALLALLGGAIFNATDSAIERKRETPHGRAIRQLDVLAEALGRYHFHVGMFPTAKQGLAALVRDSKMRGWDGPYINLLIPDPWGTPFIYEPPVKVGDYPLLLSAGADKLRGTADDIYPEPLRFEPGTAWTNGWVSAHERRSGAWILPIQKEEREP